MHAAVKAVASDPALREERWGDLNGVFVYPFKPNCRETKLA
jgi:hypothetical protein